MDESEEKERVEKRKNTPLTRDEWLGFFFFPYEKNNNFNSEEESRFIKHNFDKKLEQSKNVRDLGVLFYGFIILLLIIFFNN